MVKNLPAKQEILVGSPSWEDPLERRKWQPTPVFLPGKSHGQRILVGIRVSQSVASQRVRHD